MSYHYSTRDGNSMEKPAQAKQMSFGLSHGKASVGVEIVSCRMEPGFNPLISLREQLMFYRRSVQDRCDRMDWC